MTKRIAQEVTRVNAPTILVKALCYAPILVIAFSPLLSQTTPPPPNTANTTSACPSSGTLINGCSSYFTGLTDHASPGGPPASNTDTVTTVPEASNVSWVPFNQLLYPGYTGPISTQIDCHFQAWWDNGNDGHINIGMDQDTQAVVSAQVQNAINRGCNYIDFDWYGPDTGGNSGDSPYFINEVVALFSSTVDGLCNANGGVCPIQIAIMEDAGSPTNTGGGTDTEADFESDIQYAYNNYVKGHPSYWTMNVGGCNTRPVFLSFGWNAEGGGGGPFTSADWGQIRSWMESNIANCTNQPLITADGTDGLTDTDLDGAYNWLGVTAYNNSSPGTVTEAGISGTVQFDTFFQSTDGGYNEASWYSAAKSSTQPVIIGSAYAGFNDTNASWGFNSPHTQGRKMSRECGLVWVNAWLQATSSGDFSSSKQLPVMGIPTWNDYEEGTAIEPGIDNCLTESSFTASVNQSAISWGYSFGTTSYADIPGNTSTIHHYALWDGTNGNWTQVSTNNVGMSGVSCSGTQTISCSASLAGYDWSAGNHTLYIQAVGQPGITNHLSPSATFNAVPGASISPASVSFPNTSVGTTSSQVVTVTNNGNAELVIPQNGATITAGSGIFNTNPNPYPGCTAEPNQSCSITVTFSPTACQSYSGTLSITDNANGSPQQVPLSGTGTGSGSCSNTSTITPSSYSYGNIPAGTQSSSETFSFKNETGGTITPTLAVPTGYTVTSNACSSGVANGSSCNIAVACAPPGAGSYNGSLTASSGGSVVASSQLTCTGTSVNSGTVIYSQMQNASGWAFCTNGSNNCGGGNGTATASYTPNLSSPSEPNALNPNQTAYSADFALGGTGSYSTARFYNTLAAEDSVTEFNYDVDVYIDNPSAPQAIVFSLGQAVSGTYYIFQFQCDFKGAGKWNVWVPSSSSWSSTGAACTAFPANTWTHLVFSMNTTGGKLNYTGLTVGSNSYSLTNTGYSPSTFSPDAIVAEIYEDGDSHQDPYNLYLDNVILYNAANPQPSASFSPATLDLGTTTTGSSTATRNVTLTNSGTGPLSISSITSNNSQFVIESNTCGSSLASNSSCSVGVSLNPTSGSYGTASALLTVTGGETVTANMTGTNLNSSDILYSNLQNDSTWTVCETTGCAGGDGKGTSTYAANQTSPEINSAESGLAAFRGTGTYSATKFQDVKGSEDSYSVFKADMDVYVSDPTKPENLQFGVAQALSNNYYSFQLMCDLKGGGIWRIWNLGASTWVATSIPCTTATFNTADWTHLSFSVQRTSGNQMQYLTLTVGASSYTINSADYNPASKSPDDIEALFFETGNSADNSYSVYLSNVTISHQ